MNYFPIEKDQEVRLAVLESLSTEASDKLTICEVLRFIYDDVYAIGSNDALKGEIIIKLIDAMNMAKKMDSRLSHYKRKYENDRTGHTGSTLIRLEDVDMRKHLRKFREGIHE